MKNLAGGLASLLLSLTLAFAVQAANDLTSPLDAPKVAPGNIPEPEITISTTDDRTVHEYRINGHLYLIKVVPIVGKPYFLIDPDGNGLSQRRGIDLGPPSLPPTWVLFEW